MKQNITASEMGKIGGSRKSPAKTKAARENAKKPRKRNNQAQARPALPDEEMLSYSHADTATDVIAHRQVDDSGD